MPNPKNSGKRRQWRVKTTEAFQEAYGDEDNNRAVIIIEHDQDVELSAGPNDTGSLTPRVGGVSTFWSQVTGDERLGFIGLGRSHWESYERITEADAFDTDEEEIR